MSVRIKKYRVMHWYRRLNEEQKRLVRIVYNKVFSAASNKTFYNVLNSDTLSAEQLEFFSKISGNKMEDFIASPLLVRTMEEEEAALMQDIARIGGLAKY